MTFLTNESRKTAELAVMKTVLLWNGSHGIQVFFCLHQNNQSHYVIKCTAHPQTDHNGKDSNWDTMNANL